MIILVRANSVFVLVVTRTTKICFSYRMATCVAMIVVSHAAARCKCVSMVRTSVIVSSAAPIHSAIRMIDDWFLEIVVPSSIMVENGEIP